MEQKHVSLEKKDSILKSLAIAGFIAIIIILAWLSIQLVHLVPSAVTSLASLAEGVNQYQESLVSLDQDVQADPIVVTSNTSLITTGSDVTINWSEVNMDGSYVFSYECIDGVSISETSDLGERALDCDNNYNLGELNSITLDIESKKNRYADIPYTLAFLQTGDTNPRTTGTNVLTVINQDVDSTFLPAIDTNPLTNAETDTEPENTETTVSEPAPVLAATDPETPAVVTPEPTTIVEEFIYEVPVSDPAGTVDLTALYIGVGEFINGRFIESPIAVQNDGAIQFSVRNVGSKTSDTWTFSVDLPNGSTYRSSAQAALKPNERTVLTIGFPAGGDTPHTFVVDVDEDNDRRSNNNGFSRTVTLAE